jgi:hypothetical protein
LRSRASLRDEGFFGGSGGADAAVSVATLGGDV